ncbi:RNA polymerase sigma factor [Streptomyces sp. enrichment culture]|uniref:RNA polymerase sigma factor n=1 Tax=Streptomyces sp. enrichment culture TaxID=1795815 RepID=UPI003F54707F
MFLTSGPRRFEPSDAQLLLAVREGSSEAVRSLEERHGAAVMAYARTCVASQDDAAELTAYTFTGLRLRAARTPVDALGCVRVALFDAVRSTAVLWAGPDQAVLTRPFGAWLASGAVWSLAEDGALLAAFHSLTPQQQCVLWHASVERDPLDVIARVAGIPEREVWRSVTEVQGELRSRCAELYARRVRQTACLRFVDSVLLGSAESYNGPYDTGHLRLCADCRELFRELRSHHLRLPVQLPEGLLGWWPAGAYRTAKEAAPRSRTAEETHSPSRAARDTAPGSRAEQQGPAGSGPAATGRRRTRRGRRARVRPVGPGLLAAAVLGLVLALALAVWR